MGLVLDGLAREENTISSFGWVCVSSCQAAHRPTMHCSLNGHESQAHTLCGGVCVRLYCASVFVCLGKYEWALQFLVCVYVWVIMPDLIVLKSWRRACVCVRACVRLQGSSPQLENRVGSSDYYHLLFTSALIAELILFNPQFADYLPSSPPSFLFVILLIGLLYE